MNDPIPTDRAADHVRALIREALDDERVTLPILAAALGVLESVSDVTANLDDVEGDRDLGADYDAGRDLGANLPGGVDEDADTALPDEDGEDDEDEAAAVCPPEVAAWRRNGKDGPFPVVGNVPLRNGRARYSVVIEVQGDAGEDPRTWDWEGLIREDVISIEPVKP